MYISSCLFPLFKSTTKKRGQLTTDLGSSHRRQQHSNERNDQNTFSNFKMEKFVVWHCQERVPKLLNLAIITKKKG